MRQVLCFFASGAVFPPKRSFPPGKDGRGRMKSFLRILVVLFCLCWTSTANAGRFADAFRKFVLGPEAEAYSYNPEDVHLDSIANECIDCHDGIAASHITVKGAGRPLQVRGMQTVNHPVGMNYDDSLLRGKTRLRHRIILDRKIRLVDGKVTCISCHKLKDDPQGEFVRVAGALRRSTGCTASTELVTGPRQTDLCLSCHIK